jgi:hypothetical protein
MRLVSVSVALALVVPCAPAIARSGSPASGGSGPSGRSPISAAALAHAAIGADSISASHAIASLREIGPAGLAALLATHSERLAAGRPDPGVVDPSWARLAAALDGVAAQRDAHASRLYWYTDLDNAVAAARASGRPILSLRMLGRLDEEFSCANSRFFRMALYANADVSAYLREHFVLHWQSERPVPKVTIDFGDGRKLERTLTGNSVHYVLDARGRPVDALAGLYGPSAFRRLLRDAESEARACSNFSDAEQHASVRRFHARRAETLDAAWQAHLVRASLASRALRPRADETPRAEESRAEPTVVEAERLTVTKSAVELPIVDAVDLDASARSRAYDDPIWRVLARETASDSVLDASSRRLIRHHVPSVPPRPGVERGVALDRIATSVAESFELAMALDSVRNEFGLHREIDRWFAEAETVGGLEALNRRVYDSLFLTPASDPWLGLFPETVYTGLEGGGIGTAR